MVSVLRGKFVFFDYGGKFLQNHVEGNYDARKTVLSRLKGLILPYLVATFVYQCVEFRFWDFSLYADYVVHFNITGPFYYVLQSIQLFLAAPVLGKLFLKTNQMARKYTLYISLYHLLFLSYLIPILDQNGMIPVNIWMKRIVYFLIMIVGSIVIEYVLKGIWHFVGK